MPAGASLQNAVRSVYHMSLRSLERRWRREQDPGSLAEFENWFRQPFVRQVNGWQLCLVAAVRERDLKAGEVRVSGAPPNTVHLFILARRLDKKPLNHWNELSTGDSLEGLDALPATDIAAKRLLGRPLKSNELLWESRTGGQLEEMTLSVVHGHYEPRDSVTFSDLDLPEPGAISEPLKVETGKTGAKVKLLKMGYAGTSSFFFVVETVSHDDRRLIPVPANRGCSAVSNEGNQFHLNEQAPWFWGVDVLASGKGSSHEPGGFIHSVCFQAPPSNSKRLSFTYGLCEWVEEDRSPPMFFDRLPALSRSLGK